VAALLALVAGVVLAIVFFATGHPLFGIVAGFGSLPIAIGAWVVVSDRRA